MPLILNGSTGISGTDGSAATPAVQGTDTNTGIFFPAADTIAFAEGGVEAMRLDASGNVGIGTTSPAARLDVAGTAVISANSTSAAVRITQTGSGNALVVEDSANPDSSPFVVDASGNVGIGTTTPITNLDLGSIVHSTPGTGVTVSLWNSQTGNVFGLGVSSSQFNYIAGTTTANSHVWYSNNTERARITSGGGLLLNTTVEYGRLTVRWDNSVQLGLAFIAATGTFNGSPVVFYNSSAGVSGFIGQTASSVSYNTGSDYRLKENVVPLTDAAARVQALKPCRFNFIVDPDRTVDGFIAHEAAEVVPQAVTGEKDAVNEDGSIKPQGIDQSKLVPLLTAALQEALVEIASLKARVAVLEAR